GRGTIAQANRAGRAVWQLPCRRHAPRNVTVDSWRARAGLDNSGLAQPTRKGITMAQASTSPAVVAASSEDGFVRLTFQRLCRLPFARRLSVYDAELRGDLIAQDVPAHRAGYCEWIDVSTPLRITVGWAWFATDAETPHLLAPGGFSGNVMITSDDG